MANVLDGVRVLDFTRYIAGSYATQILSDFGAEVIKVEKVGGNDDRFKGPWLPGGMTVPFSYMLGRNKKAVTLDWEPPGGLKILERLVKACDMVVHNFSPDTAPANMLNFDSLKLVNPAIIVVAISAFGQTGPYKKRPGFDPIAQFMSGGPSYTGFPGGPPVRSQVNYVDHGTGVSAALGAMLALYHRARTGKGQMVDAALFDTAVCFVATPAAAESKLLKMKRQQMGNQAFWGSPAEAYKTRDGMVVISAAADGLWRRLLKAMGKPDLAGVKEIATNKARWVNRDAVNKIVQEWAAELPTDEIVRILDAAHIPCGRANTIEEMLSDVQVKARELVVEVDQPDIGPVPQAGVQVKLSLTPGSVRTKAPAIAENNEEIYCGLLGFSPQELEDMGKQKVV